MKGIVSVLLIPIMLIFSLLMNYAPVGIPEGECREEVTLGMFKDPLYEIFLCTYLSNAHTRWSEMIGQTWERLDSSEE